MTAATPPRDDFTIDHLTDPEHRHLATSIRDFLRGERRGQDPHGGGCQAFYSPAAWRERGEKDPRATAVLVLCHDGGDLAPLCNFDYLDYAAIERFRVFLEARGYWVEQSTCWYSVIYRHPDMGS